MLSIQIQKASYAARVSNSGRCPASLVATTEAWCAGLQGRLSLEMALRRIAEGLGARAICLARHCFDNEGCVRGIIFDAVCSSRPEREVTHSVAQRTRALSNASPRSTRAWFSSAAKGGSDYALRTLQKRTGIAETAIVTLSGDGRRTDYLEIHFTSSLCAEGRSRLQVLAEVLCRSWAQYAPSIGPAALPVLPAPVRPRHKMILSLSNPARLSRTEFRVCVLLSCDLDQVKIASVLSISLATVRAHLRSIFLKTDVTKFEDLVHLLSAPSKDDEHLSETATARHV